MKVVELTQNKSAIVDNTDYETLKEFKWHFNKKGKYSRGYAQRNRTLSTEDSAYPKTIYMHRVVLNEFVKEVDHINGDTLDNRRSNLRVVDRKINMRNRRSVPDSTSKFVGIHLHKLTNKWRAQIKVNGRVVSLGLYCTEEEAFKIRQNYIEKMNLEGFGR